MVIEEASKAVKSDQNGPGNYLRVFGLKAFVGLKSIRNPEILEIIWHNLQLILTVFDGVPMTVEQHEEDFSANDPANCSIGNTSSAFFAEIWPIITDTLQTLCKAYLHEEGLLGNLVYEFAISRSKTREAYLSRQL